MSVTVGEILVAARAGLAAVTSETVGYLILGAADRVCQASPACFEVGDIELDERGMVTVPGIRPAAQDQSELQLRGVLRDLLQNAQAGAPALDRVSRNGGRGSGRLVGEIEAALIPVNRSAARRALARLHREVTRARASGELARVAATAVEPPIAEAAPPPREPGPGTPAVELPPVELRAPETFAREEWQASVPASDEAPAFQAEATPFLGAWPVAEVPEHDTDHAPPVASDQSAIVAPVDRSDVAETTQVLFATAVEVTQPIPAALIESDARVVPNDAEQVRDQEELDDAAELVEADYLLDDSIFGAAPSEHAWDGVARIMGPVWTPVVEADVALVEIPVPEDRASSSEQANEESWIVSLFGSDQQSPAPAEAKPLEAASVEAVLLEAASVEAEPAEALASPEPVALFVPVDNRRAILEPARHAGWAGWMLTPADSEPQFVDMSETLLDGASIASVPSQTECGLLAAPIDDEIYLIENPAPDEVESIHGDDDAPDGCAEFDVTYEDDGSVAESVVESEPAEPEASELPSVVQAALLEWVVRDEALYGEILGVQDDIGEVPGEILGVQDDIGEIDWIRSEDKLAETHCEVPVAKYDPRESYAPAAMLSRWVPAPEPDADAIDAGWEIESESSAPPVSVSVSPNSETFATESPTPPPYRPRQSDVSELLAGFAVAETRSLRELSHELKRIAGVAVTPSPPGVSPLAVGGGGVETSPSCTSRTWPSSRDS